MIEVQVSDPMEVLSYLHQRLDAHFHTLSEMRAALDPVPPVFALEHDLGETDLQLLKSSVRTVVSWGLLARHRRQWLPFVVYATEHGYDYVGDKYWPPFEADTPGWQYDHRAWLKNQFIKFADAYGGARPTGAFAGNFPIIAWPITHAVLPTYLQRQLAQLLYEFRTGLSTALLSHPTELGSRLEVRARGYTERFRIFCRNTELLGHVASALLADDEEDSPYLIRSTLDRIVEGLSREQQVRHWLASARQSASKVRSSGFKQPTGMRSSDTSSRLPRATDPRFFLRFFDGGWHAYAEMPDLTVLSTRLPHVYDELARRRAEVNGVRKKLATGRLVHSGQEVRFESWPDPAKPLIQLERGSAPVNKVIADQCVMTPGPWWLFKCQGAGLAIEIKGRFLRPGHSYVLIGASGTPVPMVLWSKPAAIKVSGVSAYQLDLPDHLTDADVAVLHAQGLSVLSGVAIRPVSVVASAWDGEGAAEWLAGEPAILGVRSEMLPTRCLFTTTDESFFVDWPTGQTEFFLAMDGFDVGTHEVHILLLGAGRQELSSGSLVVTIRDPQVRPEGATPGEGIRMLASPARPTLAELWEENASVVIDGPIGSEAELRVSLRDSEDSELTALHRKVEFPVDEQAWAEIAKVVRSERHFKDSYDDAESCILTVARDGVGFASLSCERGFVPLRWRFKKERAGNVIATLTDRTGGGTTLVDFFAVDSPLVAVSHDPHSQIRLPIRGGLLRASSDEAEAIVIAPTNANALLTTRLSRAVVHFGANSPVEIVKLAKGHRLWGQAEPPPDAFAAYEQQIALDAIARAIPMMVCGGHWADLERRMASTRDPAYYLDRMQDLMGLSEAHKALGEAIAYNLYKWSSPGSLLLGFHEVIASALIENGLKNQPTAARFLLTLAGRPGYILDWPNADRDYLLERIVASPVLLRAGRFAVLGTRILNDQGTASRGF